MNIRPVLIEKEDKHNGAVVGSSGALIEEKYVLATSNLLSQVIQENGELLRNIEEGTLHLYTRKPVKFRIFWKKEGEAIFFSEAASLLYLFKCRNISEFYRNDFKDWRNDPATNNVNPKEMASIFLILAVEGQNARQENLQSALHAWFLSTLAVKVNKCDKLWCVSSPFGSRDFLNSVSEGIVSTTLKQSTLFLSDCSSAPGSEGGLVYIKKNLHLPVGIVISSFNWWRKEWLGFTLVADIRPIIRQLLDSDLKINKNELIPGSTFSRLLELFENCLAQINCGANWGTCILLSKDKGIFLTNAHVVRDDLKIRISWKNNTTTAKLIYKCPDDSAFDLALIKSDDYWTAMVSPDFKIAQYKIGDAVYCAGYPLLSTTTKPEGITVTRGIISTLDPYAIKTSCSVYPGFSGGAVFSSEGVLVGIIVSNTKLNETDVTYPRQNMAIPFRAVEGVILDYLNTEDVKVLEGLRVSNVQMGSTWKRLDANL